MFAFQGLVIIVVSLGNEGSLHLLAARVKIQRGETPIASIGTTAFAQYPGKEWHHVALLSCAALQRLDAGCTAKVQNGNTNRRTNGQTNREARQAGERERDRDRDTEREGEKERQRQRQGEKETDTEAETEIGREGGREGGRRRNSRTIPTPSGLNSGQN